MALPWLELDVEREGSGRLGKSHDSTAGLCELGLLLEGLGMDHGTALANHHDLVTEQSTHLRNPPGFYLE